MCAMMPTNPLLTALVAVLLLVACPVGADEASHREAVVTLFRLTAMEQKIDTSVDDLLSLQLQQNPELAPNSVIVRDFLERTIGWNALQPELLVMYQAAFSEEELRQINAFYITPVGQKVLTRVPELVQERNRLAAQRLQEHIGELQQALQEASSGER
jgi:hypothetical protein